MAARLQSEYCPALSNGRKLTDPPGFSSTAGLVKLSLKAAAGGPQRTSRGPGRFAATLVWGAKENDVTHGPMSLRCHKNHLAAEPLGRPCQVSCIDSVCLVKLSLTEEFRTKWCFRFIFPGTSTAC